MSPSSTRARLAARASSRRTSRPPVFDIGAPVRTMAAVAALLALVAVGLVCPAGPPPASAAGPMLLDNAPARPALALSDPNGQRVSLTDFTKLTTSLSGLNPRVVSQPSWSEVFDRVAGHYSPAKPASNAWQHVQGQSNRDTQLTAGSALVNKSTFAPIYSFKVRFAEPVANPKLDLHMQNVGWYSCTYYGTCPSVLSTVGSRLEFSNAMGDGANRLRGVSAVAGVTDVPYSRYRIDGSAIQNDGYGCFQNGTAIAKGVSGTGCYNNGSYSSQVRSTVGSWAGENGYDLAGTIQLDTGGQAVSEVTLTYLGRFAFPSWNWRKVTLPSISIAYAGALPVETNNLRIDKSVVGQMSVRPGETITYGLTLSNSDGQPTSKDVQIVDELPAQLTEAELVFEPVVGSAAIVGSTLTWTIPAGTSSGASLQLKARVRDGAAAGPMTNTAQLSGLCGEQCTASATAQIVSDPAVLALAKTAPATVAEGGHLSYQVTLTNTGGAATTGSSVVTDDLPAGIDPESVTMSASLGSAGRTGARITWTLPAGIEPADARGARLVITGAVRATAGETVTNTARVTAGPCAAACSSTVMTKVTGSGAVGLTKTNSVQSPGLVTAGEEFSYTIRATNTGDGTASDLRITDALPSWLEFTSNNQPGWTITGTQATSDAFSLAPGKDRSFELRVRVKPDAPAGTELRNTAIVAGMASADQCAAQPGRAGCGVDPNPPSVAGGELQLTKQSNLGPDATVKPGQQFTYTITATNAGSATMRGVRLVDPLPAGLRFAASPQEGWSLSGTHATSEPFDLTPGQVKQLTLFVEVTANAEAGSSPRNAVVVADGPTTEQCLANSAMSGCGVDPDPPTISTAILGLHKSSDVGPEGTIRVGDPVTYTIVVTNTSNLAVGGIQVVDQLPLGLQFDPPSQPGWTVDGRRASADLFTLGAGESATLTLRTVASEQFTQRQRNIVMILDYQLLDRSARVQAMRVSTAEPDELYRQCEANPTSDRCSYADVVAAPTEQAPSPTASAAAPAVPATSAAPQQPAATQQPATTWATILRSWLGRLFR